MELAEQTEHRLNVDHLSAIEKLDEIKIKKVTVEALQREWTLKTRSFDGFVHGGMMFCDDIEACMELSWLRSINDIKEQMK